MERYLNTIGEWTFSFDRKIEFNMFKDYLDKLTMEQKKIFDDEKNHTRLIFFKIGVMEKIAYE